MLRIAREISAILNTVIINAARNERFAASSKAITIVIGAFIATSGAAQILFGEDNLIGPRRLHPFRCGNRCCSGVINGLSLRREVQRTEPPRRRLPDNYVGSALPVSSKHRRCACWRRAILGSLKHACRMGAALGPVKTDSGRSGNHRSDRLSAGGQRRLARVGAIAIMYYFWGGGTGE